MIDSRLIVSLIVFSVDNEVTCVNVVAFDHHLKDLWLVHNALLHEVHNLVLHQLLMVHIVVQLHLQLILKLTILLQEVFFFHWVCELLVVFSQQVHLAVVCPGVVPVAHWVHCPNSDILATSE